MYVTGYYCIKRNILQFRMLDLVLVGQVYFGTGQIIRNVCSEKLNKNILSVWIILGLICSVAYLYTIKKYMVNYTVDYPSREFHNIYLNYISGIMGSILLFSLSKIIEKYGRKLKSILMLVGQNTFGIIIFHFLAYTLAYAILAYFSKGNISNAYDININKFGRLSWLCWVIYAITFSIILWKIILKNKIGNILLGKSYVWEDLWKYLKKIVGNHRFFVINKCSCLLKKITILFVISIFIISTVYILVQKNRSLNIKFPYKGLAEISFEQGWLPQENNENYRWINKIGEIDIKKGRWNNLYISGYVPDSFIEVNSVEIFLNGKSIFKTDLQNRDWEYSGEIFDDIKYGEKLKIEIEYNNVHFPEPNCTDVRIMSGVINEIRFY